MADVVLEVNGWEYSGWSKVQVMLGMEQIAGTFDLSVTDRWPGQTDRWPIREGDECTLKLHGKPVITGYVDDFLPAYDKESHTIQVTGRDRTGDLVDCSAIHKGGEWRKVTLAKLVKDICSPFSIPVTMEVSPAGLFSSFALQESETAFEAIERACRQRGVLPVSDGLGGLLITRAGKARVAPALVKGQNIEKADARFSLKERFSKYIIKGQSLGDNWQARPERHTQLMATVTDSEVRRYRPICIIAEQGNHSTYKDRATWECNVRAGRGSRVTYTVSGWEHSAGLWRPNRLVPVQDDFLDIDGDRLIANVAYTLDEQSGTQTHLEVCRREAFDLIALPSKKKAKAKENLNWSTQ